MLMAVQIFPHPSNHRLNVTSKLRYSMSTNYGKATIWRLAENLLIGRILIW